MSNYYYRSEDDLRELYIEKNMTQTEIAELLNVSPGTVSKWMNRHGIETGNRKWSDVKADDVAELYDPDKSFSEMASGTQFNESQIRHAATKIGIHDPDKWTNITYEDEELLEQIESVHAEYGFVSKRLFESLNWTASVKTIRDHFGSWLNGVIASSVEISDHQKHSSSAPQTNESRNYDKPRGSQSKYKSARIEALERDEYECVYCGSSRDDSVLHTHHIKPVHKFEDPNDSHVVDNLITLCKKHHNHVHANKIDCPESPKPE